MKYLVWIDEGEGKGWEPQGEGPFTLKAATRIAREIQAECPCKTQFLPVGQQPEKVEAPRPRLLRCVKPGHCGKCAVLHAPEAPHNQQSLFWQYSFMEEHGRWPTWADAMAHCPDKMKAAWTDALAKKGITV